ncbi:LysR substrate-binding domain-containing protein [Celerinatantimonas yamalensis]|uniref:LysR substrate-binding domain-containing protein n=1 Tax=Celerinatantimonas yamalensis TaxID=559956 RepID=A0ABW9G6T0_9GAMM
MAIKIHQLQAFKAVAQQGSIRAASRQLALSQPSLTKAIKELELTLGVQLFHRGVQGVTLTQYGHTLLQHAHLALNELEQAQHAISQQLGQMSGQVSIGLGASVACSLLPHVLARFRQDYPQVSVRISEGQMESHLHRLRSGDVDFAINTVYPDFAEGEFSLEPLFECAFKVLVRRNHPLAGVTSLAQLSDCDWMLPTTQSSYIQLLLDELDKLGILVQSKVICESYLPTLNILAHTDCIGIVSELALEHFARKDQLQEIVLQQPLPLAVFYIIQRRNRQLLPTANQLMQLFRVQSRPLFECRG